MYSKTIQLGSIPGDDWGYEAPLPVTVHVELRDREQGASLAIQGSIWKPKRGDTLVGGQCHDEIAQAFPRSPRVQRIVAVWKRWHLNDMRPGCAHQRAMRWSDWLIDPAKPKTAANMWAWVPYGPNAPASSPFAAPWRSHVRGLLSKPCPCCGYKYGSAWLFEPLPARIIAEVTSW